MVNAGRIACVVDTAPGFQLEALRWFASATRCAGVAPEDLTVHSLATSPTEVLRFLESKGVEVVPVRPFDVRSPHSNKIAGALSLAERGLSGPIVLTDSDIALLSDPRTLCTDTSGRIWGKTVDSPMPPLEVLERVFRAVGLSPPEPISLEWMPATTLRTNMNGGLYVLSAEDLTDLAPLWAHWAEYLLDRHDLLERWMIHADQVAMAVAIVDCGLEAQLVSSEWNFPTHRAGRIPSQTVVPQVLHYHRAVDAVGRLRRVGVAEVDERIDRVNGAVAEALHGFFPNRTFWDWRYATNPELGSGVGSRGETLEQKRHLLEELDRILRPRSVLDVGCGDGFATSGIFGGRYTGLDVSPEALAIARQNDPEGTFLLGSLDDHQLQADLVICLDVLIHQAEEEAYQRIIGQLVLNAQTALLVSGYESPPRSASPMVHYHEPLSNSIRRLVPEAELYPVLDINDAVVYLCLLRSGSHPRDFTAETLAAVVGRHSNALLLLELRLIARSTIGFYPDHGPRLWEYPRVATEVLRTVAHGASVIDIGAGVNPLVPFLADRGLKMHTVDPASRRHTWPIGRDANEWGFVDYAKAGFARRSWNCRVEDMPLSLQFDLAYSVSMVEHLPSAERRALLLEIAHRLSLGARLLLTVDLIRGTTNLWNRSEGKEVEPLSRHGTLEALEAEAGACGFQAVESDVIHGLGHAEVDIGWLVLALAEKPAPRPAGARWLAMVWDVVRPLVPRRIRAWAFPRLRWWYYRAYPGGRRR